MRPPPDRSSIDEISEMGTLEPSARFPYFYSLYSTQTLDNHFFCVASSMNNIFVQFSVFKWPTHREKRGGMIWESTLVFSFSFFFLILKLYSTWLLMAIVSALSRVFFCLWLTSLFFVPPSIQQHALLDHAISHDFRSWRTPADGSDCGLSDAHIIHKTAVRKWKKKRREREDLDSNKKESKASNGCSVMHRQKST